MNKNLAQVAIVGRANVGKSTLFNRFVEKNKAIVSDIAGTTRDRNIDTVKWRDREFTLVDTGGLDVDKNHPGVIEENIVKQAQKALKEADLILFVVDAKDGILPADKDLAKELIKQGVKNKILLVSNKADSLKWRNISADSFKLNFGEPIMVSAANGSGVGDLLDIIVDKLPKNRSTQKETAKEKTIKVAIIGKPNVGKSSILNSILGEERVIVTNIAHTTREAHDIDFTYKDHVFTLVDTAGIMKSQMKKGGTLEKKSMQKSISTISNADVVLLIMEANKKVDAQDKKITQEILENSKSLILVANKWDLIEDKGTNTINEYVDYYRTSFPYLWWAPLIFISAKDDLRTKKILDMVLEIKKSRETQLTEGQLDHFLKTQIKRHRPSRGKGLRNPYIYKIEQVKTDPPRFVIHVNDPEVLHFSYIRFLQNNLREKFKIMGTPIQIELRKWKSQHSRKD